MFDEAFEARAIPEVTYWEEVSRRSLEEVGKSPERSRSPTS